MGYPTKVQMIRRKGSAQFYLNFPWPLARALNFAKGEVVEWEIRDQETLVLRRKVSEANERASRRVKKNR